MNKKTFLILSFLFFINKVCVFGLFLKIALTNGIFDSFENPCALKIEVSGIGIIQSAVLTGCLFANNSHISILLCAVEIFPRKLCSKSIYDILKRQSILNLSLFFFIFLIFSSLKTFNIIKNQDIFFHYITQKLIV